MRLLTRWMMTLTVLWFAVLGVIAPAAANEPVKLSLLNAASKGGESSYGTINDYLKKSSQIETSDQDDIWEFADKEFGLEAKDFRSSSLREEHAEKFQEIMKELDLEALIVLDVFSKGRKMQLVTIGPSGKEIADIRRDVNRGRIDKDDAKSALKDTFEELGPAVLEFRENGGWEQYEKEEEEDDDDVPDLMPDDEDEEDEEDEEDLTLKQKAIKKKKKSGEYPALDPGVRLQVGLLVGKRGMSLTSDSDFELSHGSPFVGFGGRVNFVISKLGSDAAVGGRVLGGYAPFTTIFNENESFKSAYARIGLQLEYLKALGQSLILFGFGGGEAMSITIAQNDNYTGHRYIMARAGAGILYDVGPVVLEIAGAILPVFGVNNSAGAYGEVPGLSLGFEPMAGLRFGLSEDLSVSLRYSGQIFSTKHPEPVRNIGPAKVSDIIHSGLLAIGYSL